MEKVAQSFKEINETTLEDDLAEIVDPTTPKNIGSILLTVDKNSKFYRATAKQERLVDGAIIGEATGIATSLWEAFEDLRVEAAAKDLELTTIELCITEIVNGLGEPQNMDGEPEEGERENGNLFDNLYE